ncbi:MAG: glutamyl-tRNA reductase [Candidatus Limnocylindria bacterium]
MSQQAALGLARLHQRDALLDARELFAAAAAERVGPDLLLLSTCHRVECYVAIPPDVDHATWVRSRVLGGADPDGSSITIETDEAAVLQLLRAAMGLDSVVRGEGQILVQLRDAYDRARASGGLHPLLSEAVQRALHLAREVRSETSLGRVRRSVGSLAVDSVVALLPRPAAATVLVVGAGEVGKLASRALASRVGSVLIANRDAGRARQVADAIGATALGLDDLERALLDADAVISAADTRGNVLTVERLQSRVARGPLLLVDIAVPRSVGEDARSLPGLVYRSVDHLDAGEDLARDVDVERAERMCAEEARRFTQTRRERLASPTIEALRDRAERIRRAQLDRALAKLGHLDARDRRVVEALSTALTGALLHGPTVALREDPLKERTARELFGLEAS